MSASFPYNVIIAVLASKYALTTHETRFSCPRSDVLRCVRARAKLTRHPLRTHGLHESGHEKTLLLLLLLLRTHMSGSALLTMVWSSAARNTASTRPAMICRTAERSNTTATPSSSPAVGGATAADASAAG